MAVPTRGRLLTGLLCLVAIVAIHFLGIFLGRGLAGGDDTYADPGSVELPPPPAGSTLDETRAYLASDGAVVSDLTQVSASLTDHDPGVAECRSVAENDLPRLGSPDSVQQALAAVPDQATAELALAHLDATMRFLARCLQDGSADGGELGFTRTLLVRRLEELS